MSYLSYYPFFLDRDTGQLTFSYDYFIPAYIDPESFEYFDQTSWSLIVTEPGVSSGGISDFAGESGQIFLDFSLLGGDDVHTYRVDFNAFNTFSAVSISETWNVIMAAYASISLAITGGNAVDLIIGGAVDDVLNGADGNDMLDGGEGVDTLNGDAGADRLDGGVGDDVMSGGVGDDAYFVESAGDTVLELAGGGTDTVLSIVTHTLAENVERLTLVGTGLIYGLGNFLDNVIVGNSARNILGGGNGNDSLNGAEGNDTLSGGKGDDTLIGGAGADRLNGGPGHDIYVIDRLDILTETDTSVLSLDTVYTAADMSSYTLLENFDILRTLSNESFHGRGNNQRNDIHGGIANDFLQGFGDSDGLSGGAGNDRLEGGAGADEMRGGDGRDVAIYANSSAAVIVNLGIGISGQQGGEAQGDWLLGIEDVIGSRFNDILTGILNDNALNGGAGDDIIAGYFGDDRLTGGEGADQLDGQDGIDTLEYFTSTAGVSINLALNTASGGDAEGDTFANFENVFGSNANDTIVGDAGTNDLRGAGGDDVISGGDGNDTLVGGAGADWLDGEGGINRVSYAGSIGGVTVDLHTVTVSGGDAQGDQIFSFDNAVGGRGADNLFGHGGANSLAGAEGNDLIQGRGGADILHGGAGADVLDGGDGIDTVSYAGATLSVSVYLDTGGGAGGDATGDTLTSIENAEGGEANDYVRGDAGANWLKGRAGFDYLDGLAGNDFLTGGANGDTFRFASGHGRDVITDFTQGQDLIFFDVDGGFTFEQAMTFATATGANGEHTRFEFGGGDALIVYNVQVADFTVDDFYYFVEEIVSASSALSASFKGDDISYMI